MNPHRIAQTELKQFGAGTSNLSRLLTVKLKLTELKPKTRLGLIANEMVVSTANTMIGVTAISGYCNALTESSLPIVTFTSGSSGAGISDQELQQAWNTFQSQFSGFQGDAAIWVNASSGTSILTQLTSLPENLQMVNSSVQMDFSVLISSEQGSDQYSTALDNLNTLIGAQIPSITGLNASMVQLGNDLDVTATTMVAAVSDGGVLSQIIDEYQDAVDQLNTNIANLEAEIDADNKQITADSIEITSGVGMTVIGAMTIIAMPFSLIFVGMGIYEAVTAAEDIQLMKAQIAADTVEIQNSTLWAQQDSTAATAVSVFANQVSNCSGLNSAAQQELTTLENLYTSLATDLQDALNDLAESPADADAALAEWNAVMAAAAPLSDLTMYIWPSPLMLTAPTGSAAAGSDFHTIDVSGSAYRLESSNTWSTLPDKLLSVAAGPLGVFGINGASADGSHVSTTPYDTNYLGRT